MAWNLESLLVTDNQSRGEPTLAGAGENQNGIVTTTNSIIDLFGRGADVYNQVRNAVDGNAPQTNNANQGQPRPTTSAQGFLAKYGLWLGLGAAALLLVVFTRK